jgi:translation initiation factor 3 subunit B
VCFADTVTAFAWEPRGDRFLLITTNDPNAGLAPGGTLKTNIAFYQLDTRKGDFVQLSELLPLSASCF